MLNLGTVKPGSTIYIPFSTFDSNDPSASVIVSAFVVGDIAVYKDGGTTQRASTTGYTLLDTDGINFDGVTGAHGFSIDLSSNATANFYEAGSDYMVLVGPVTVDAATINFWAARFTIGYPDAILNTTVATLASQTGFTLEEGPADNDALNGCRVLVHDLASAVQIAQGIVSDYVGSTKTVTLKVDPGIFTMAAGDNISFFPAALVPTTPGNTLDVNATGEAGLDLDNTSGTLSAAQFAAAFITASKFGAGAIDAAAFSTDAVAEIVDGVFDEDIVAAHGTADTAGLLLRALGAVISQRTNNATLDALLGVGDTAGKDLPEQVWAETVRILTASTNFNDVSTADLATALTDIHLDHLLAVDYDPASKPGVSTALLNELIESNGGVSRFTAAALFQTLQSVMTELSAPPVAAPTAAAALQWLYMASKNKRDTIATTDEVHNDAGTIIGTASVSDDAVTFTKGKYA